MSEPCPSCGGTGWVGHANDPDGWCARCYGYDEPTPEPQPEPILCESCEENNGTVKDRMLDAPYPCSPQLLCDECHESALQQQAERDAENAPFPPPLRGGNNP